MIPVEKQMMNSRVHMIQGSSEGRIRSKTYTKDFLQSARWRLNCDIWKIPCVLDPHLTDMENSPGALSLSLTRKAPHSRCLSRLSATLRDIRPANHLEEEEDGSMRSTFPHTSRSDSHQSIYNARGVCQRQIKIRRRPEDKNKDKPRIEKQN